MRLTHRFHTTKKVFEAIPAEDPAMAVGFTIKANFLGRLVKDKDSWRRPPEARKKQKRSSQR